MTTKDSSKNQGKKGIKYNYFTLTVHLCVFAIVTDKLPWCDKILHDIKSIRQSASLKRAGFFQVRYLTGLDSSNLHCMKQEQLSLISVFQNLKK